ncbi:cell division protein ZapE [Aestuariivirga litoralis]|uniref:Cell division protein ZapE n=1 Tax=Aestuariivirga litoralis TaxID=2650924 RepID=A0A2W2AS14_9HYPH|nr:cell division protein ZapE [Aestuariivirga litoralis]PZF75280.1 cell division protein ZapE [Aestuariivirga litoralis]
MAAILAEYDRRRDAGLIRPDAAQRAVVARLDQLATELQQSSPASGLLARFKKSPPPPKGLYIFGEVGRGKTMVMDLFYETVQTAPKRRVHFHAFMQDVHRRLHAARQSHTQDAIVPVARALAREARLLCLDEMQVTDIADAMIVGRLFEGLLAAGTVIVTTSNLAPDQLYRNGLNRQLFLPFIALIRQRLDVVSLESPTDYRLGRVKAHETFLTPISAQTDARLQDLWQRLTDTERGEPMDIDVLGRKLHVPQAAHGCARFSFGELCEKPLGPPDYLALAENFPVLFVEHIPELNPDRRNEAKRFVLLIDTLYDARVRLVATSAQAPEGIYPAGDHAFEFGRTVSRLKEMQSASWWGKKIAET